MFELKKIEAEWKARMHKALSFDGKDDYVEVPDSPSLDIADEITVMAWVKPAESKRQVIVSKRKALIGWLFQINKDNRLYIYLQGVNGCAGANSTSKITIGQWNHVTFIGKMNDVGTFAINGVLEEWKSLSIVGDITNDEPVQIGTYASGEYGRWFNGLIAHVRIYNRALSASEIKYLYRNWWDLIDPEHLVLWLNPAGIDVANSKWWDLSGKGNHGTIHGATEVKLVEDEVIVE